MHIHNFKKIAILEGEYIFGPDESLLFHRFESD